MTSFKEMGQKAIEADSDRLTFNDFLGDERKQITLTHIEYFQDTQKKDGKEVTRTRGKFFYVGCKGKPYVPCVMLNRFIFTEWGGVPESPTEFQGRVIGLYGDKNVKVGRETKGGVRIWGMSDIPHKIEKKLVSGQSTMQISIVPITPAPQYTPAQLDKVRDGFMKDVAAIATFEGVTAMLENEKLAKLKGLSEERYDEVVAALTAKQNELKESTDVQ